jgi:hypothetical protein
MAQDSTGPEVDALGVLRRSSAGVRAHRFAYDGAELEALNGIHRAFDGAVVRSYGWTDLLVHGFRDARRHLLRNWPVVR